MNRYLRAITPARRRWAYRVLVAGGAVAVGYGIVTSDELGLWLGLANVVLGGLADANVTDADAGRHEA